LGGPDIFSFRQLMEMTLMHIQRRRLLVPVPFFCYVMRCIDRGSLAKATHNGGSSAAFKVR
ncbi:hypothetical protein OBB02_01505, partial [Candidatus Puniceispirillum sp.]|nr:hypothetical protein [Candidatus Puniceispirillum sp.]